MSSVGLHFNFYTALDSDEFMEGETFSFHTYETFETISSNPEYADVVIMGHPLEKSVPKIEILSSGKRGESKFSLTMVENGESVLVDTIPADGKYTYKDFTFYFTDSVYQKGMNFKATVKPNEEKSNTVPIIILLSVVAVLFIGVFVFLLSKVENKNTYRLQPYKQRQDDSKYE